MNINGVNLGNLNYLLANQVKKSPMIARRVGKKGIQHLTKSRPIGPGGRRLPSRVKPLQQRSMNVEPQVEKNEIPPAPAEASTPTAPVTKTATALYLQSHFGYELSHNWLQGDEHSGELVVPAATINAMLANTIFGGVDEAERAEIAAIKAELWPSS